MTWKCGHPRTPENTAKGECRQCKRTRDRARYQRDDAIRKKRNARTLAWWRRRADTDDDFLMDHAERMRTARPRAALFKACAAAGIPRTEVDAWLTKERDMALIGGALRSVCGLKN